MPSAGGSPLVYWGARVLLGPLLSAMQTGHHVDAACVWVLFFLFALFFFAVIKPVCMEFNLPYVYPSMGIITVSCRGSAVRQLSECRVSLVFPELCFFQSFFKGN